MSIRQRRFINDLCLSLALTSLAAFSACGLDPVPSQGNAGASTQEDGASPGVSTQDKSTETSTEDIPTKSGEETSSASTTGGTSSTSETSSSSTQSSSSESTSETSSDASSSDSESGTQLPGKIDCDTLKFTGFEPGQVPNAVSLTDSQGQPVQLRDACNETVVIISGDST